EASKQGAAFARVVRDVWALEVPDVVLPLAVSHAARQQGIAVTRVVPLYLQSFAGNIISAAQRLMPLGQTGAQRVMRNMQPVIQTLAADTAEARLDDLYSNAFLSDIAAMRQEHLEVRVFQS
ncbi:MAG: urease accessory UreF family protein, partial [Pseudomonadota bacterium]